MISKGNIKLNKTNSRKKNQFHTTSATINESTFYVKDVVVYESRETVSYGKISGFYMKV